MSVKIQDKQGVFVREYSLEDHGENYMQLAEQFATKMGYDIISNNKTPMEETNTPEVVTEVAVEETVAEENTFTEASEESAPEATPETAEEVAPEAEATV